MKRKRSAEKEKKWEEKKMCRDGGEEKEKEQVRVRILREASNKERIARGLNAMNDIGV